MADAELASESRRRGIVAVVLAAWIGVAGCSQAPAPAKSSTPATLTVGFGLTTGTGAQAGMRQAALNIALEGMVAFGSDGRPQPWLADSWRTSSDGLTWHLSLRRGVKFHDGKAVDAAVIRDILLARLPGYLGTAFGDIRSISASGDHEIEVSLERRSTFLLEGLGLPIQLPGAATAGTGPFLTDPSAGDDIQMIANDGYHGGRPLIDRIVLRPYSSVRAAWADLLRGRVDMLYDVGVDAIDLLQPSRNTIVYRFERPYSLLVILNTQRAPLKDAAVRRALNAGIDREAIVQNALRGYGSPQDGPVWPHHWAYNPELPRFQYHPRAVPNTRGRTSFRLLYAEPSHERLALLLQRQLQEIGVDVTLETLELDQALAKVQKGDFDAFLADAGQGPVLLRPYLFWKSGSPVNWGQYSNAEVDQALDDIRAAASDDEYRRAVAEFQRAIVDDPPAIFLAWSERARAVSTRFDVPVEAGRDILSTLRLWRPVGGAQRAALN
jgi:peptide/nickel transport system substrate-binding protein